jgi:hypothetical protein
MPMADRPFWPPGAEITAQAWDAFDQWRAKRDPDGDMDLLEAVWAYADYYGSQSVQPR